MAATSSASSVSSAPARFFDEGAKAYVRSLVEDIERETAAELVVAVHPESAPYREAEWLLGTVLAAVWLLLFLYLPQPFAFTFLPLELLAWFAAGVVLARLVGPVKRALVRGTTMQREVERTAKALFHDLGVTRTRGRTGVLVYASMLEGRVVVLRDGGVPGVPAIDAARTTLDASARRDDFPAFAKAIRGFTADLSRALPRSADDVNELDDALVEKASKKAGKAP